MIRVRIAPSPSGAMHVGTARTALFNWIFAKKNNGVFILRIEDTDKERSKKEYEKNIIKSLEWLGLDYSEFYRQSERTDIYKKYIEKLLESGSAFYCYHSKEELEKEKEEQAAKKLAPRHTCFHKTSPPNPPSPSKGEGGDLRGNGGSAPIPPGSLPLTKGEGKGGGSVIRFNNPCGKIKFNDLIRGKIEFDADLLGDFSIAKDESTSLYNLAAAIDDYEMKISQVIRGEDHISNTPKQILIYQALGLEPPQYAHLPMILGPDKSKLSKRHGATSLLDYRDQGYLPDAMFNFLALLGWAPSDDREIMSRDEVVKSFSLEGVQKSGAVFNIEKLDWMNGEYIRKMPLEALTKLCLPFLSIQELPPPYEGGGMGGRSNKWLQKIVALEQPRMKKLSEIGENTAFFFQDKLEYDKELLRWKNMKDSEIKEILEKLQKLLSEIPEDSYTKENLEKVLMPEAEKIGDRGRMLWPLRVALTGRKASPGPFEVAEVLGKQKCLQRLEEAENVFH